MPNVRPDDPAYILDRKRESYRNTYGALIADGSLSAKDLRVLTEVRDGLGLSTSDYTRIERELMRAPSA